MAYAYWGMQSGKVNEGILLTSVAFVTAIITLIFERIHPKHKNWNIIQNDVKTDAIHALVSMIVLPQVLEIALRAIFLVVAVKLVDLVGFDLSPNNWPLAFQLIFAMLVSQFGEYWIHRGMHEVLFLWRFHAVHHSPKRLY